MLSVYLKPNDYGTYGLPSSTTDAQVITATAIINGYLNKPDGLIYLTDITGLPVVMEATGEPISVTKNFNFNGSLLLGYKPVRRIISVSYNEGYPDADVSFINANIARDVNYLAAGDLWLKTGPRKTLATVQYIAGWTYETLPDAIKIACASIVNINDADNSQTISGPVISRRAGDTEEKFASASSVVSQGFNFYINNAIAALLANYRRVFA